jgi:hypothetical protein
VSDPCPICGDEDCPGGEFAPVGDDACDLCGEAGCPGGCAPTPALCPRCQVEPEGTGAAGFLCPGCHKEYCRELDQAGLIDWKDVPY